METRVLDGDGELRRQRRQKRDVVRAELPAPWVGDEQPDRVVADPQRDADRTRAAGHVDPDDIAGPERAERELEDILGEGSVPFGDLPARRQRQLPVLAQVDANLVDGKHLADPLDGGRENVRERETENRGRDDLEQ